eukprot:10840377-Ditylum_brightwellii.AAC.1
MDTLSVKVQVKMGQKVYIPNGNTTTAMHACHIPFQTSHQLQQKQTYILKTLQEHWSPLANFVMMDVKQDSASIKWP